MSAKDVIPTSIFYVMFAASNLTLTCLVGLTITIAGISFVAVVMTAVLMVAAGGSYLALRACLGWLVVSPSLGSMSETEAYTALRRAGITDEDELKVFAPLVL